MTGSLLQTVALSYLMCGEEAASPDFFKGSQLQGTINATTRTFITRVRLSLLSAWNKLRYECIVPCMNWHILLANVIVFLHVLFVGFVVVMVPVILIGWWRKWQWVRNFWLRLIHFLMIMIVVVETVAGVPCPLTIWERDLRLAGGQLDYERNEDGSYKENEEGLVRLKPNKEYDGDFVARLLNRIIFYEDVPAVVLESCYYGFGALILLGFVLVPPRWPWKK